MYLGVLFIFKLLERILQSFHFTFDFCCESADLVYMAENLHAAGVRVVADTEITGNGRTKGAELLLCIRKALSNEVCWLVLGDGVLCLSSLRRVEWQHFWFVTQAVLQFSK